MGTRAFELSSVLPAEYRDDLEAVLFFNPQQSLAGTDILHSMDTYGAPSVGVDGDLVRVTVGTLTDVQMLFALADTGDGHELAGVVLFYRADIENLLVLHIAVTEPFSAAGSQAASMLVVRMIHAVRVAARRLKGVRTVTIMYRAGRTVRIPVRPSTGTTPGAPATLAADLNAPCCTATDRILQ